MQLLSHSYQQLVKARHGTYQYLEPHVHGLTGFSVSAKASSPPTPQKAVKLKKVSNPTDVRAVGIPKEQSTVKSLGGKMYVYTRCSMAYALELSVSQPRLGREKA